MLQNQKKTREEVECCRHKLKRNQCLSQLVHKPFQKYKTTHQSTETNNTKTETKK